MTHPQPETDVTELTPTVPVLRTRPPRKQRLLRAEAASLPADGSDYLRFLRGPRSRWWRGALAIVLAVVSFSVVAGVVANLVYMAIGLAGGMDEATFKTVDPVITLVSVAAGLPIMVLIQRWVFRVRGRWLHSVEGRFRWRLALRAALVSGVTLIVAFAITTAVDGSRFDPEISATAISGVIVAVVVIPFQGAAEEYLVRGIIARSAGSWARTPLVGLAVSALMSSAFFAVLHGNLLPGLMIYYMLFGAILWWLTWRTGGLEAAIAVHAVFNILVFLQAFLFAKPVELSTTVTAAEQFSASWVLIPVAVAALLVALWFRRAGVRRTYSAEQSGSAAREGS